jgi:hypothetical protein
MPDCRATLAMTDNHPTRHREEDEGRRGDLALSLPLS